MTMAPVAAEFRAGVASDDRKPVEEGFFGAETVQLVEHADEDFLDGVLLHFCRDTPAAGGAENEVAVFVDQPGSGVLIPLVQPRVDGALSGVEHWGVTWMRMKICWPMEEGKR